MKNNIFKTFYIKCWFILLDKKAKAKSILFLFFLMRFKRRRCLTIRTSLRWWTGRLKFSALWILQTLLNPRWNINKHVRKKIIASCHLYLQSSVVLLSWWSCIVQPVSKFCSSCMIWSINAQLKIYVYHAHCTYIFIILSMERHVVLPAIPRRRRSLLHFASSNRAR